MEAAVEIYVAKFGSFTAAQLREKEKRLSGLLSNLKPTQHRPTSGLSNEDDLRAQVTALQRLLKSTFWLVR